MKIYLSILTLILAQALNAQCTAVVHTAKPNGNLANLDLRFQADGIYVLRVQSLENTSNFRIVKN